MSRAVHQPYTLRGGPYHGLTLPMAQGNHTLPFKVGDKAGRYVRDVGTALTMSWEPAPPEAAREVQPWLPSLHPEPPFEEM